jgi:DNA-directed RNA polymerase specialized sigma24 family protein
MTAITTDSFDAIYGEFAPTVRRKIARAGVPIDDIPDVCQLAWLHIWRYREGYDSAHPVSTFVAMAADHAAARYWRDRLNKPELVPIAEDHGDEENDSALRQTKPFIARTESGERGIIVRDIMQKLPDSHRICLELRQSGLSHDEVGRELGYAYPGPLERRAKDRFKCLWQTGKRSRRHKTRSHCQRGHDLREPANRYHNGRCRACRQSQS